MFKLHESCLAKHLGERSHSTAVDETILTEPDDEIEENDEDLKSQLVKSSENLRSLGFGVVNNKYEVEEEEHDEVKEEKEGVEIEKVFLIQSYQFILF
jgi:hypothetical protein